MKNHNLHEAGGSLKETGYGNLVYSNMGYAASIGFKSMQGPQKLMFPLPDPQSKDPLPKKEVAKKTKPKIL